MSFHSEEDTSILRTCFICCKDLDENDVKSTSRSLMSGDCRTTMSRVSILSIINNIVGVAEVNSITSISNVCTRCFNLLDSIDTLQVQLRFKNSEVVTLFETSKANRDTINKVKEDLKLEEKVKVKRDADVLHLDVIEPPKKKDKGLLTSDDLKCQVCLKTFDKRRYLMDHLRRVHKSSVYKCNDCHIRFKLKDELNSHLQNCSKSQKTSKVSEEKHIKSVLTDNEQNVKILTKRKKNNRCHQCNGYFLTQALLKTHVKTVHEGEQIEEIDSVLDETKVENPVICNICDITVNNEYALAIHQGSVHGSERPWTCNLCGKTFARHLELVNHRRIHSGDKPFQCDVCGARFNQKQNLHTHVRHIHLGERRYECDVCKMKFRRKRLLDCHINSKHKFERPYSCRLCKATFVYPEHVRKHELTHRTDRMFRCDQCNKVFKNKPSLENHMASHRPQTSYQCLSCPQYYATKEKLLDHLREANHPKGVYSCQPMTEILPVKEITDDKDKAAINMSIIETVNVYDDVVLYLASEVVSGHEDDVGPVYVEQVVHAQDEVQTAISSIVEIEDIPASHN